MLTKFARVCLREGRRWHEGLRSPNELWFCAALQINTGNSQSYFMCQFPFREYKKRAEVDDYNNYPTPSLHEATWFEILSCALS